MNFDLVYRKHYPDIYRFAFRLTQNESAAKDFAQEAFTKLYFEIHNSKFIEKPRSWLCSVVINQYKNEFNKQKRKIQFQKSLNGHRNLEAEPETGINEIRRAVYEILQNLPENDRILLMLYQDGYSYKEMAALLKMNENSVGKTLSRSIARLTKALKKEYHELFE